LNPEILFLNKEITIFYGSEASVCFFSSLQCNVTGNIQQFLKQKALLVKNFIDKSK